MPLTFCGPASQGPEASALAAPRQETLKEVFVSGCPSLTSKPEDRTGWAEWLQLLFREAEGAGRGKPAALPAAPPHSPAQPQRTTARGLGRRRSASDRQQFRGRIVQHGAPFAVISRERCVHGYRPSNVNQTAIHDWASGGDCPMMQQIEGEGGEWYRWQSGGGHETLGRLLFNAPADIRCQFEHFRGRPDRFAAALPQGDNQRPQNAGLGPVA